MDIRDGVLKAFLCLLMYSPLANFNQTKAFEAIDGYHLALTANIFVNRIFFRKSGGLAEQFKREG